MANCHATNKNYLFGHNIKERVKLSMKTTYKILLMVISLLLVVAITIGTSYSLWKKVEVQTNENIVNSACYDIVFEESSNINLKNAMPISDASGLKKTPYTFTIKNTCNTDSKTTIALNVKNTSTMSTSAIKTSIKSTPQNTNSTPVLLTSLNTATIGSSDSTTKESYIITTDTIRAYNSKTFSLYLWMDEDVGNEEMNKVFNATISVTSEAVQTNDIEVALYQGLIPVTYNSNGDVVVANTNTEWYNYDKHKWANAVLVNCSDNTIKTKYFNDDMSLKASAVGQTISMDEILQMYVYIPRYRYLLWNAENGTSNEQMINIEFERYDTPKSTGSKNGEWLTHPAFTFGDAELPGIWVGKFETTGTASLPTIKPNTSSLRSMNVSSQFNTSRLITTSLTSAYGTSTSSDSHMMKNLEWGAVAYLSSSIYGRYFNSETCIESGCEIWMNGNKNFITGCTGNYIYQYNSDVCNEWNNSYGPNASTTGNVYGVYDMSGGANEYVMAATGFGISGFSSFPDSKYMDNYNVTSIYDYKLGDAVKETIKPNLTANIAWYNGQSYIFGVQNDNWVWQVRSGAYYYSEISGIFEFHSYTGATDVNTSFRLVITAS